MTQKQTAAIEKLISFVGENLPDSISGRQRILDAAREALPGGHKLRAHIAELSFHLHAHQKKQMELFGDFSKGASR